MILQASENWERKEQNWDSRWYSGLRLEGLCKGPGTVAEGSTASQGLSTLVELFDVLTL